jgi:hypothetical protein
MSAMRLAMARDVLAAQPLHKHITVAIRAPVTVRQSYVIIHEWIVERGVVGPYAAPRGRSAAWRPAQAIVEP